MGVPVTGSAGGATDTDADGVTETDVDGVTDADVDGVTDGLTDPDLDGVTDGDAVSGGGDGVALAETDGETLAEALGDGFGHLDGRLTLPARSTVKPSFSHVAVNDKVATSTLAGTLTALDLTWPSRPPDLAGTSGAMLAPAAGLNTTLLSVAISW